MNPTESRASQNPNRVRIFSTDQLSQAVTGQKWDRAKVVCTQPFNKVRESFWNLLQIIIRIIWFGVNITKQNKPAYGWIWTVIIIIITNEKIEVMLSRKGEISECQSKLWTNRNVFSWCLNGTGEETVRRDGGRLFHARGAATGKARSPIGCCEWFFVWLMLWRKKFLSANKARARIIVWELNKVNVRFCVSFLYLWSGLWLELGLVLKFGLG